MDKGAWRAAARGVAKRRTRLSDSHTQKIMASASFAAWTPRPMCFFWLTHPVFPPVGHPQG